MIIGNKSSFDMLKAYFDSIKNWTHSFNFLICSGINNIGKSYFIETQVNNILGEYTKTDFMHIEDKNKNNIKKNSIKVESWSSEEPGTREIITWLSKYWISWKKILLIENIERMTISATNSLLKTLEELSSSHIVVWTTSNENSLLDTIISRALLIRFWPVSSSDIESFLDINSLNLSENQKENVVFLSQWRPWLADFLAKELQDETSFGYKLVTNYFSKATKILDEKWNYKEKLDFFMEVYNKEYLEFLIDSLIFYYSDNDFWKSDAITKAKKYITNNVSVENTLYWMILEFEKLNACQTI